MNTLRQGFNYGVDLSFYIILGISIVFLVGLTTTMIYFVVKYNKKRHPKAKDVKEKASLEITWIAVPTILVLVMFYFGWAGYKPMRNVPDNAIPVKATGRMWSWSFEYDNGKTSPFLVIPVNFPVKLDLYSPDVLHSLFIPAFRIKEDVVPGVNNYMWFQSDEIGEYDILCAEYCGLQHANMLTKVKVVSMDNYKKWYNSTAAPEEGTASAGEAILTKHGCFSCHSRDGSKIVGPTLKNLWNSQQVVTTDGNKRTATVDKEYIVKSIYEPNADIPEGYQPNLMISYKGQISEKEIDEIIEYLKSLK
ncbi:MAG: cytochrome c oxidase subunit II [Bacteroidales bacterium]